MAPPIRSRNLYDPESKRSFRLSRSKIDLFLNCPRCFYLDRRMGVAQVPGFPFNLNSAVDTLLKNEFDYYRSKKEAHPYMKEFEIDAIPYEHESLDAWRDSLRKGITYLDEKTNLLITGGIDDVWINSGGQLHIVDYKATSRNTEVSINAPWQVGYRRQVEIYQWLFAKNGFEVSPTAYFVYCNGMANARKFESQMQFKVKVIAHEGSWDWVDLAIKRAHTCLNSDKLPPAAGNCQWCTYRKSVRTVAGDGA